MTLIPWRRRAHPRTDGHAEWSIDRIRSDVDRVFDRFVTRPWAAMRAEPGQMADWLPPLDVLDKDQEVTVRMEVPGMCAGDFDITVDGRYVTIAGDKKESAEDVDADHFHCERCFGSFHRTLEMPETADMETIEAFCSEGVLTLVVPKVESAKARKISVSTPGTATTQQLVEVA